MFIDLIKIRNVHCVGIGGIGVSAIARMLRMQGKRVTGSDAAPSPVTDMLRKLGIKVKFGHAAKHVGSADLVIYTKAVSPKNPELLFARRKEIPCLSYAEILGVLSRDRFTIAIAGTHGKTTTTAMIGRILRRAGQNPTIIVGGIMKDEGTNFVAGKGKYLVVEACEYKKSFLDLHPRVIVITNIDNDHLDYYRTLGNVKRAFLSFAKKLGPRGVLVCDANDPNVRAIVRSVKAHTKVVDYRRTPLRGSLKVVGAHNKKNAQAALTVANILKVPKVEALEALRSFRGVGRRFEYKGSWRGVRFYDDYAHHPTEVKATLRAARDHFGESTNIWCVFQPHLYSRTRLLMNDFAESFRDASMVLLADIYAAREKDDGRTNSHELARRIRAYTPAEYGGSFSEIADMLTLRLKRGDVVITMGAGEAYKVWNEISGRTRGARRARAGSRGRTRF